MLFHCNNGLHERASMLRLHVHCLSFSHYVPTKEHERTALSFREWLIHRGLLPKCVHLCYLLTTEELMNLITVERDKEYRMLTLVGQY